MDGTQQESQGGGKKSLSTPISHTLSNKPSPSYKDVLLNNYPNSAKEINKSLRSYPKVTQTKSPLRPKEVKKGYKTYILMNSLKDKRFLSHEDILNIGESLKYDSDSRKGKKLKKAKIIPFFNHLINNFKKLRDDSRKDMKLNSSNITIHTNPFQPLMDHPDPESTLKPNIQLLLNQKKISRHKHKNKSSPTLSDKKRNMNSLYKRKKEEDFIRSTTMDTSTPNDIVMDENTESRKRSAPDSNINPSDTNKRNPIPANTTTSTLVNNHNSPNSDPSGSGPLTFSAPSPLSFNPDLRKNHTTPSNPSGGYASDYPPPNPINPSETPSYARSNHNVSFLKPDPRDSVGIARIQRESRKFQLAREKVMSKIAETEKRYQIHTNNRKYKKLKIKIDEEIVDSLIPWLISIQEEGEQTEIAFRRRRRASKEQQKDNPKQEDSRRTDFGDNSKRDPKMQHETRHPYEEYHHHGGSQSTERQESTQHGKRPHSDRMHIGYQKPQQHNGKNKKSEKEKIKKIKRKSFDTHKEMDADALIKSSARNIRFVPYTSAGNDQDFWTVNIKNVHPNTSKEELLQDLEEITGDIPLGGHFDFNKMYCYVDFANRSTVLALIGMSTLQTRIGHVNLMFPANDGTSKKCVLFLKGFPARMQEEWLTETLNDLGIFPDRVHILVASKSQRKTSAAFIHFSNEKDTKQALLGSPYYLSCNNENYDLSLREYVEIKREPQGRMGTNFDFNEKRQDRPPRITYKTERPLDRRLPLYSDSFDDRRIPNRSRPNAPPGYKLVPLGEQRRTQEYTRQPPRRQNYQSQRPWDDDPQQRIPPSMQPRRRDEFDDDFTLDDYPDTENRRKDDDGKLDRRGGADDWRQDRRFEDRGYGRDSRDNTHDDDQGMEERPSYSEEGEQGYTDEY